MYNFSYFSFQYRYKFYSGIVNVRKMLMFFFFLRKLYFINADTLHLYGGGNYLEILGYSI